MRKKKKPSNLKKGKTSGWVGDLWNPPKPHLPHPSNLKNENKFLK
jgi:hypothetical protein